MRIINYFSRSRLHSGTIKNISRNGLFIKSNEVFRIGDALTLILQGRDRKKAYTVKGRVVRVNHDGFAMDFKKTGEQPAVVSHQTFQPRAYASSAVRLERASVS